jgi:hypothetical protein
VLVGKQTGRAAVTIAALTMAVTGCTDDSADPPRQGDDCDEDGGVHGAVVDHAAGSDGFPTPEAAVDHYLSRNDEPSRFGAFVLATLDEQSDAPGASHEGLTVVTTEDSVDVRDGDRLVGQIELQRTDAGEYLVTGEWWCDDDFPAA